eukprot:CAMPEP_0194096008 /NCGR_PEP_ID=MMETSP0149-20130528/57123_1 /TAXON_ID=122233 /ORGANISM="Chaetoceros debilis, Strain MM31A-1" /LENGTH=421 /DNA_ID=CAMNT_0038781973 /DNA_START=17 /DNA_END=1280 /DNA_ORIENTATION=+
MKTKGTSSSSAGYFFYKGLALTSIDVIKTGDTSWGGNPLVHFDGTIKGRADDKDATFLKNIKEVKDATGKKVLEAEKLTVAQAKAIINQASSDGKGKPLFCIHGFNVQPRTHLKKVKAATVDKFNKGKFMPIPVMWPSEGGATNYWGDRKTTPGAGNGLKSLKKALDSFPSKSLLAHSMGNRVLRYAADAKFKFDNIFMVAADVRHDIFHKDYINSGDAMAKAIINQASSDGTGKPLFCIHGFSVQPRGHLKAIKEATVNRFNQGKFMPIPVMWPSGGGVKYLGDRKTTPGAGNGLKSLKKALDSFPSKSLLAHSMGNRVLRHAADSKLKFDNIFMVAADVRHDIFHKDYINSGDANDENRTELQGKKICSMLSSGSNGKPKGKVYVLYNGADYALTGSRFIKLKLKSRLGAIGAHCRRNW